VPDPGGAGASPGHGRGPLPQTRAPRPAQTVRSQSPSAVAVSSQWRAQGDHAYVAPLHPLRSVTPHNGCTHKNDGPRIHEPGPIAPTNISTNSITKFVAMSGSTEGVDYGASSYASRLTPRTEKGGGCYASYLHCVVSALPCCPYRRVTTPRRIDAATGRPVVFMGRLRPAERRLAA